MPSNYPPGMTSGYQGIDYSAPQTCQNEHVWTTPMFQKLGAWFYVDEDYGPVCPVCELSDLEDGSLAEKRLEASKTAGNTILHVGPNEPMCVACEDLEESSWGEDEGNESEKESNEN